MLEELLKIHYEVCNVCCGASCVVLRIIERNIINLKLNGANDTDCVSNQQD